KSFTTESQRAQRRQSICLLCALCDSVVNLLFLLSFILNHAQIGVVPPRADLLDLDGPSHRTMLLLRVRAVGKFAQRNEWPHYNKEAFDFFGQDVQELKLPQAGRAHGPAATGQGN